MFNKIDLPNIGDRIQITIKRNLITQSYSSQILDIIDKKKYVISGPIVKNTIVPLNVGTEIQVYYVKEERGRFNFKGRITGSYNDDIYKINIERVSDTKRIQERDYYRLPSEIKVLKTFFPSDNEGVDKIQENCIAKDISGGGMKILCKQNHNIGDKVECAFSLNNSEITLQGIVVRREEENKNGFRYSVGIQFIDIPLEKREEIIKYIFEEQRKLRKKGLI